MNAQDPIDRKSANEKICNHCNINEDSEHFFLHCVKYSNLRLKMFMEIESILQNENNSIPQLRQNLLFLSINANISQNTRENILHAIEKFISNSKRFY